MNKENNLYKACQGNNFSEERYVLLETGEFPSKYKMAFDNAHYLDLNKITDEYLKKVMGDVPYTTFTSIFNSLNKISECDEERSWDDSPISYILALTPELTINFCKFDVRFTFSKKYTLEDIKEKIKIIIDEFPKVGLENKPAKVQLVAYSNGDFYTVNSSIKATTIDIAKNYNDDFLPEYDKLVKFIKQKESGIGLLSGAPGTGKTSLVRHITTNIPGNYVFITPSIASYLGNPEFVSFLLDNKNSIFILEDCEQLLKERTENTFGTSIANILNMTDGILSDIFNIKFICTFNASETVIDPALLREGRCYFNYKFDKLKADKVAVLNKENNLGIPEDEICDMTLAELYNYSGSKKKKETKKIGF